VKPSKRPDASLTRAITAHFSNWAVLYLALCCAIFTMAVYWPGYMSPDSVAQFEQARYGVTDSVYPPLMAYIWRVTDRVVPGPGGMLILNNIVFWGALAGIARLVTPFVIPQIVFVLLAGFWPATFCTLGTIWKDVGMQVFLLGAVAFGLAIQRFKRHGILFAALTFVFLIVASGYRHNALVAALPLACLAIADLYPALKDRYPKLDLQARPRRIRPLLIAASFSAAVAVVIIPVDFVYSYGIQPGRLQTGGMLFDLAGISVYENHNYLPVYSTAHDDVTLDDLKHMYSPLHVNSLIDPQARTFLGVPQPISKKNLSGPRTDQDAAETMQRWFHAVFEHPDGYLHHRMGMAARLFVLPPLTPWYPYIDGIDANPFGLVFRRSKLNRWVMSEIQYAAFSSHFFAAWIYYIVLLLSLVLSLLWKFRYGRLVQILVISSYLYLLSILTFGMSGDFRYNIWAITSSYLCIFLLLFGRSENSAESPA
jgi:hypothetical protein